MSETNALSGRLQALVDAAAVDASVAVLHVERDERLAIDGDVPWPACSVFKVPVLVEAFRQAAAGEFSLLNRWQLSDDDKATGSGVLQLLDAHLALTVHDLATLMIVISDNTAADILLRRLGPENVTRSMEMLGLRNTWVSVTCRELLATAFGEDDPRLAPAERARRRRERPAQADATAYHAGRDNDVTSANDMVDLFACLQTGDRMDRIGLGREECLPLLAILLRQQLNDRLPRYLPATLDFAHKTGSLGGAFEIHNDTGILTLENGDHIALAVFTRAASPASGDPRDLAALRHRMDDLISEAGRAVYDHYAPGSA